MMLTSLVHQDKGFHPRVPRSKDGVPTTTTSREIDDPNDDIIIATSDIASQGFRMGHAISAWMMRGYGLGHQEARMELPQVEADPQHTVVGGSSWSRTMSASGGGSPNPCQRQVQASVDVEDNLRGQV
jgi:hypothetical protein